MPSTYDRLFELLPAIYRVRDVAHGGALQAVLGVLEAQYDLVEEDIRQLYDNWFIETCEDWVVPYLGDLIGYESVADAGLAGEPTSSGVRLRNRFLAPRSEVANTIALRRRKGTLAALEQLANEGAGWPARAVEFYRLLSVHQHANFVHPSRGRGVRVRESALLDLLGGPFNASAHSIDVRRPASHRTTGQFSPMNVGVFVWRLGAYSVTKTMAFCREDMGDGLYTFSVLGNDAPLFVRPVREIDQFQIARETNVPAPLRRRALRDNPELYYGVGLSLQIWKGEENDKGPTEANAVPRDVIRVANLKNWFYEPEPGTVVVDPVLGRIAFPAGELPAGDVWVSYHYGFSADMGGGEYPRQLRNAKTYRVSSVDPGQSLSERFAEWLRERDAYPHGILEISDSAVYAETLDVRLRAGEHLEIRAADGTRPVIDLPERRRGRADPLPVSGAETGGSRFTLDGLLVVGRGLRLAALDCVTIRHSTLVPGWDLDSECEPCNPTEPSIFMRGFRGRLVIDHSIVGAIHVNEDEVRTDPIEIHIRDSIVDAASAKNAAVATQRGGVAHAVVTIARSTVIGRVSVHAIALAGNTIFMNRVHVARRQMGCMRFCYVPDDSRTPRRHHCQPDLVVAAAAVQDEETERERVVPQFTALRYGLPGYCQLADTCAEEILRGADDESELGAFHDLFQPQREATLRARLFEYTPAGTSAAVLHAT